MRIHAMLVMAAAGLVLAACGPSRPEGPRRPPQTATVSPNGEPLPFQAGQEDCRAALAAWFVRTDSNGDGVLSLDEMQADASRWFAQADLDHDGMITADELATVRRRLVPEPPPEPERRPTMERRSERGPGGGPGGRGGMMMQSQSRPDPVMQADANADFQVSAQEFHDYVASQFDRHARNGVISQAQVLETCRPAAD